jgi:hypothetical protein
MSGDSSRKTLELSIQADVDAKEPVDARGKELYC